jgi:hypothetical protein
LSDHELYGLSTPSQLFTVRVWVEPSQDGGTQMRVQVKHVLSGATRTLREWSQVIAFIENRLQDREESP